MLVAVVVGVGVAVTINYLLSKKGEGKAKNPVSLDPNKKTPFKIVKKEVCDDFVQFSVV